MSQRQQRSCQIYLMVEAGLDPDTLKQALDAGPVAAVLLKTANIGDAELRHAIGLLRPVAQERETAFLVENEPGLVAETGCDGVHLSQAALKIRDVRRQIGEDAIAGVACGDSRHAAIEAAEAGADYVAFGGGSDDGERDVADQSDLLSWWQALMTVPCVAFCGNHLKTAGELAVAGADFVAVGRSIWTHPGGPGAAIRELRALLAGPET